MSTPTPSSAPCPSNLFPSTNPNYRYFNQPIELIPGWDQSKDQVLVHAKDSGLVWVEVVCLPVVTCIQLDELNGKFIAERKNVTIIKDFDEVSCSIDVIECPTTSPSPSPSP